MKPAIKMSAAQEIASRQAPAWNNRILVVEDEREIAKSYCDILAPESGGNVIPLKSSRSQVARRGQVQPEFQVDLAYSAEEGMAMAKAAIASGRPYGLAFIDVLLGPGADGLELFRELHQYDPNLFAVFVTAYHDRSVDSIRQLLGDDKTALWDYLNKPFNSGEIQQKARNFISLWNLKAETEFRKELLSEAQRRLLEGERHAAVAAVARGVTHEFGNILMQIIGKADLYRNRSEVEMRQALEKILDAGTRATEILSRFKDLAGSPRGEGNGERVIINDVIDGAVDLMEHTLKSHETKICKPKWDVIDVPGHSTSLMQVFVNIMVNAAHAMGRSGQIDVSVHRTPQWAEVRVRDYGPGIKPELLNKVMEPFFTTKGKGGTGLGLPICKEIIEIEHNGEFHIANHGVKGLEILIRLPLKGESHG